jgi:hypothetical protein
MWALYCLALGLIGLAAYGDWKLDRAFERDMMRLFDEPMTSHRAETRTTLKETQHVSNG